MGLGMAFIFRHSQQFVSTQEDSDSAGEEQETSANHLRDVGLVTGKDTPRG